jgi:hypothetical protein
MEIETRAGGELVITGNIKSIQDSALIKQALSALCDQGAGALTIRVEDSFSMTSTVIGLLMKLVNVDQLRVSVLVGDPRLYQLLEELCLIEAFNVRCLEK